MAENARAFKRTADFFVLNFFTKLRSRQNPVLVLLKARPLIHRGKLLYGRDPPAEGARGFSFSGVRRMLPGFFYLWRGRRSLAVGLRISGFFDLWSLGSITAHPHSKKSPLAIRPHDCSNLHKRTTMVRKHLFFLGHAGSAGPDTTPSFFPIELMILPLGKHRDGTQIWKKY